MIGKHTVQVRNNRKVRYDFTLNRNITIVQGDSGTGKTTLFDMIAAYAQQGEKSGVYVNCDVPCIALRPDDAWESKLQSTAQSIVFIDEDADYACTEQFASAVKASDNYYVLFSREAFHNLPYSVEEIYEIKTSGKYHTFRKRYKSSKGLTYAQASESKKSEILLTEDSHAGYQFYQSVYEGTSVQCVPAGSNSNIFPWLMEHHDKSVVVVADGAAFGCEMGRLMTLQHQYAEKITICLPECFEWLILQSGLIDDPDLQKMLADPSEAIDSSRYFSWENFFTDYLIRHTANTHYAYSKSSLCDFYTLRENREKIIAIIAANLPKR